MWILTVQNDLVNTNQVTSILVKDVQQIEYSSPTSATKVDKKALVAGLSDGSTHVLVSFASDVDGERINAYMSSIKQGLANNLTLCDLTVV